MRAAALGLIAALAACSPATTRPRLAPLPEALSTETRGGITAVTEAAVRAVEAEGIPVARAEPRDGWFRTEWLDTAGYRPVSPGLGLGTVRVRGWVDPGSYGHSRVTLEAVWRPRADPSLPERELERALPPDHPVMRRLAGALARLADEHAPQLTPSPAPPNPAP